MRTTAWLVAALTACGASVGVDADGDGVPASEDCDDGNADIRPGATEVCDGLDNDCDAKIDDADDDLDAPTTFEDLDGDGFGGVELGPACSVPAGAVLRGGDCADDDDQRLPGATEVCDEVDNDCDGLVDDADPGLDDADAPRWFRDKDEDGYGSSSDTVVACAPPASDWASLGGDCDDNDDARNPGAPEICDGKDNNCDVATGLLVDEADPAFVGGGTVTWYRDLDNDGYGAGSPVADCDGGPGLADNDLDCDDTKRLINPGAAEVCDGVDNDCDGTSDDDQWWDDDYAYRIPVTVTGPNRVTRGPAVAVTVSPSQALAALGDAGTPVPASYRLVLQDCPKGFPQLPFDFVDAAVGLLDSGTTSVAGPPFEGTLVFRHDTDGSWATKENLPANGTEKYALYFSSTTTGTYGGTVPTAGSFTYTPGATTVLESDVTRLELATANGGLATSLGLVGGSNVAGQAVSTAGNGMFLGPAGGPGAWVQATDVTTGTITSVHQGDVAAVLRSSGTATSANGSYAYTVTWLMVQSRPEVYAKVAYVAQGATHVGPQSPSWTAAVRPFQVDNQALLSLGASTGYRDPAFRFVRATYDDDALGVVLGWRDFPLSPGNPVFSADGRFLGLVGQDFEEAPTTTEVDVGQGDRVVDEAIVVAIPYAGTWTANETEALATVVGARATAGTAQAVPTP